MKFGCCGMCGNILTVQPPITGKEIGIEIIEKLKEIGYDYIELSLFHIAPMSDEEFVNLKQRIDLSGLKCEVCNNFIPDNLKITGDKFDMDKIMKYVEKALYRANQLGVEVVVFGSAPAKRVPEGFPIDKAWNQLIDLSRQIDTVAKKYSIIIAVEPIARHICNIINTVEEGLCFVKEVNKSNIRLLADYYHMCSNNEDPDVILKAGEYIKHIHFAREIKDDLLRVFPRDINEYDYMPFINNLKKINYQGRISIEAHTRNFDSDAEKSLQFVKKYFDSK